VPIFGCWVLGAASAFSPKRPKAAVPQLFSAPRRVVTSRAAENLFWFGRYTERAENTVRLARLCLEALNGEKPGVERVLELARSPDSRARHDSRGGALERLAAFV
jgi:hypothetical protein